MDSHSTAIATVDRREPAQLDTRTMSPVVAAGLAILERNPSPETLRELLAVQEAWEKNEARKAYAAAIVALKRDLPTVIAHDKTVDFISKRTGDRTYYSHTSLAAVMDAITEPLTKHGFSLSWNSGSNGQQVTVTCRLTHVGGHFEESPPHVAPADQSGSKSTAQGIASTITLLSRYSAAAMLGIATRDMGEPKGEQPDAPAGPAPDNTQRNMACVSFLAKRGKTREQAEKFVDLPVSEWQQVHRDRLRAWAEPPREPGQDG